VQGADNQIHNHAVTTGGLINIDGMLSDRRHTRLISEYGGLKAVMPRFVAAFLLITLSSIALPGMNGFVGEFLILLGGFLWNPKFAAFAASGVILSAVYMLWMFQRVNYGELTNAKNRALPDLTPREWALVVPTIAVAIVMGIFPVVFLRPMEPAVKRTIERVTGRSFAETPAAGDLRLAIRNGGRVDLQPARRGSLGFETPAANVQPPAANREPQAATFTRAGRQ
jgi:NADH-quinone oxidoreductase subunit M